MQTHTQYRCRRKHTDTAAEIWTHRKTRIHTRRNRSNTGADRNEQTDKKYLKNRERERERERGRERER